MLFGSVFHRFFYNQIGRVSGIMETMEVALRFIFLFGSLYFIFNTFIAFSVTFVTLAYYLNVPVMVSVLTIGFILVFVASRYVQRKRLLEAFADDMVESAIHHQNISLVKEDVSNTGTFADAANKYALTGMSIGHSERGCALKIHYSYIQSAPLKRESTPIPMPLPLWQNSQKA